MIYTLENHNFNEPLLFIDSKGEEVKNCVYCDTITGKVKVCDTNDYSSCWGYPIKTEYRPPPIREIITQKAII